MQPYRNDQLSLPDSFLSLDCLRQSAHFFLSLAHSRSAAFHFLMDQVLTSSTVDEDFDAGAAAAGLSAGCAGCFCGAWAKAGPQRKTRASRPTVMNDCRRPMTRP